MKIRNIFLWALFQFLFFQFAAQSQIKTDQWLKQLLISNGSPLLQHILEQPDSFQYQIIYTRIDRDRKNQPSFTNYYYNVDPNRYFNPASTVKLPTALAALEKLNQLAIAGVDKNTVLTIDSSFSGQSIVLTDSSSINGMASIGHYMRKIFLVSDNDAYNRLYEFVGQQGLNETLRKKGYVGTRITRRFVPMTEEENRHTNAMHFIHNGQVIYTQPPAYSNYCFDFSKKILVGNAHFNWEDSLIAKPMDFTTHNNFPLQDLQQMVQSVLFPSSIPAKQRFKLTDNDMRFFRYYMSELPSESHNPIYDTSNFFDSYTKFFYKDGKQKIPSYIRIFNKPGWSYGFLTDAAYVADFKNNIEFMLSAVIYVNADGVLNDNKYEYETIGYPFFNELYRTIYNLELKRERKHKPNLKEFLFTYDK